MYGMFRDAWDWYTMRSGSSVGIATG
jgi:hypothetical protein